jgi:hypothetical protein
MNYFIDNNLSPRIARALCALEGEHGDKVIHLKDKFDQKTTDEEWMTSLGHEKTGLLLHAIKGFQKIHMKSKLGKKVDCLLFF